MKKTKFPISNKFENIKEMFKSGDYDLETFDFLTRDLLNILCEFTMEGVKGDKEIEGVKLDLWKDRVFHLIERAGLLPEYKDEEESSTFDISEVEDAWYKDEDEFGFDEDEFEKNIGL